MVQFDPKRDGKRRPERNIDRVALPGANYNRYRDGGLSFGPVGLKGTSSGGSSGQWVLAELLGLVSVERRACLAESCGPLPDLGAAIAEVLPFEDA